MEAGELLRIARLESGLNQAELARRAATTQSFISRVERGAVSPSTRTLGRLLNAAGCRITLAATPLSPGNVSPRQLRSDLEDLTAAERVQQAMDLSEFLTGVAAAARKGAVEGSGR